MDSRYPLAQMGKFLHHRKEFFEIDDAEEYQLVTVQLHARGIRERSRLLGSEIKTKRQQRIRTNDLLIAEIDAKVGGYGIVPASLDGAIVSSHYFLYEVDTCQVELKYLDYYLKSGYPVQEVGQYVKGSVNYAAIRPYHFPQLHIPLPPLDEQRQIVAKIEAVAKRVEEAEWLQRDAIDIRISWLLSLSRSVFKQLVDKYSVEPLGGLFKFRQDLLRPSDGCKKQVRFVGLQHIEPNTGRKIGEDVLNAEQLKGRKFRFSSGEIVYGYLRPYLNKVWIADCEGLCSVDQYVLCPDNSRVETAYLAQAIRSPLFLEQSEKLTGVLMLPRLRSGLLQQIQIPIPPRDVQIKMVEHLEDIQEKIDELRLFQESAYAKLTALLPAMLERAFRGEL